MHLRRIPMSMGHHGHEHSVNTGEVQ
jgi:hypothetical protein